MKFFNMNKYVSTTVILIFMVVLILIPLKSFAQTRTDTNPQPSNAVDTNPQPKTGGTFTLSNPLDGKVDSVAGLVKAFVEIFSYLAIILAVLALIWVGFQYIISRGDVAKMTQLKNWLFWIVIGVAVVIGARVIIEIVINTLAATNVVDQGTLNSVRGAINR